MNETSALKGGRLHQIAIQNRLPTVTFVQSVSTKLTLSDTVSQIFTHFYHNKLFRPVQTYSNSSVYSIEVVLDSVIKLFSKGFALRRDNHKNLNFSAS